jgi:integrase
LRVSIKVTGKPLVLSLHGHVKSEWDVAFPSHQGKLRDRSNTNTDIRQSLDPLGFDGVTSHTFRKTAATLLDASGLSVREIADQLGHRRVSMTQDIDYGLRDASPDAARAVDVIASPARAATESPEGDVRLLAQRAPVRAANHRGRDPHLCWSRP